MAHIGRIELLILGILCMLPVVLGAVALVIVWVVGRDRVPCPYCGERIRREARICRFCGRDVRGADGLARHEAGTER